MLSRYRALLLSFFHSRTRQTGLLDTLSTNRGARIADEAFRRLTAVTTTTTSGSRGGRERAVDHAGTFEPTIRHRHRGRSYGMDTHRRNPKNHLLLRLLQHPDRCSA